MWVNIRRELKVGDYFWHDTEPRDQDGKIYPGNHIYNVAERAFVRFIMATLCDKGNFLRETFDKSLFVCDDVLFHVFAHRFLHLLYVTDASWMDAYSVRPSKVDVHTQTHPVILQWVVSSDGGPHFHQLV